MPEPDASASVVIIGAGACGLTAALAAKDAGAEVIVLERDQRPFGSTGMSYGAICAAGTQLQHDADIDDDTTLLYDDIIAATQNQTDGNLARLIAESAGPSVDWLVNEHQINLSIEETWTGLGHQHPRLHAPPNRSGADLVAMLVAACERSDVDLLTGACVTTLFADGDARIHGVGIQRRDGSTEVLGCEALIFASCGFGGNPDLVRAHIPDLANARYYGHEGNTGDAIAWGQALGAAIADMGSYQALGSLATPQSLVMPHTLLIGGGVQVNARGERFENELQDISGQALTILDQPDGICWMVYDQRLHDEAMLRYQEYRDASEINAAKKAPTWQQLAALIDVPTAEFENTMQEVTRHAESGSPDRFGRNFYPAQALQPPFFAVRVTGALFHTQGGLVVDNNAQVKTTGGGLLPNVFAGGGAARSVSGPSGWGYLPGMGLCMAVTLGRIAGESAAGQVAASASQ